MAHFFQCVRTWSEISGEPVPPPIVEAAARGWEKNIQGSETKRKVEKMGEEKRGGGRETPGNEGRSLSMGIW